MAVEILIGVLSALLATFLSVLVTILWRTAIYPWIRNTVYRGVRVDGTWKLVDSLDRKGSSRYEQYETIELKQKATGLRGRLTLIERENAAAIRTLDVRGFVQDRFVILNCTPATRRGIGYVVYLGQIVGDGQLCGSCVYYHIDQSKIVSVVADYKRVGAH